MALPMIDPNSLNALSELSNIIQFPTVENAIENIVKVPAIEEFIILTPEILTGIYAYFTEGLTGGVKSGFQVGNFNINEDNSVTYDGEGAVTYTPIDVFMGALYNALGINAYISSGQIVNDLIYKTRDALVELGVPDITWEEMKEKVKVPTILKQSKTYFNKDFIQNLINKLISKSVFSFRTSEETLPISDSGYLSTVENVRAIDGSTAKYIYDITTPVVSWYATSCSVEMVLEALYKAQSVASEKGYSKLVSVFTYAARYSGPTRYDIGMRFAFIDSSVTSLPFYKRTTAKYGDVAVASGGTICYVQCWSSKTTQYQFTSISENIYSDIRDLSQSFWVLSGYEDFTYTGQRYIGLLNTEIISEPTTEGVEKQKNSTLPSQDVDTDYPSWTNTQLDITQLTEEGVQRQIELLPLSIQFGNITDPYTNPQEQAQQGASPSENLDPFAENANAVAPYIENIADKPIDPKPEDGMPGGTVPPFPTPSIVGQGLFTVYNPSQSQLDSAGSFLWGSSGLPSILNIFKNNPLDAVISLQMVYATPTTGSAKHIIFGNADSGVSAPTVTKRYEYIDCGTIEVAEIFGNATDYEPFTTCNLYLPFIGIVNLSANDIIASKVNVKYGIDIFTGSVVAFVRVEKYNYNPLLYTFEGNCAVDIPLTGNNRSIIAANTMRSTLNTMVSTGGNLLATMTSAGLGAMQPPTVSKSGSFSSNVGAMSPKIPYLIITRQIPNDASAYNTIYGYPANETVVLGSLTGFTKVKDIHVENINVTENEREEIEMLLKEGVFL